MYFWIDERFSGRMHSVLKWLKSTILNLRCCEKVYRTLCLFDKQRRIRATEKHVKNSDAKTPNTFITTLIWRKHDETVPTALWLIKRGRIVILPWLWAMSPQQQDHSDHQYALSIKRHSEGTDHRQCLVWGAWDTLAMVTHYQKNVEKFRDKCNKFFIVSSSICPQNSWNTSMHVSAMLLITSQPAIQPGWQPAKPTLMKT